MRSGLLILPLPITESISGILTGVIIHRTGKYLELIWVGLILMTVGNGLYINLKVNSSLGEIIGYQIVSGTGAGLLFQTPIIAIQAMVSQKDTATATATIGFIRNLAMSSSIVIGGVVFQNSMSKMKPKMLASGLPENVAAKMSGDSAVANVEVIKTIKNASQLRAVREAFAWSLRNMWILYTALSGLGIFACFFMLKTKLTKEHVETRTGLKPEVVEEVEEPSSK